MGPGDLRCHRRPTLTMLVAMTGHAENDGGFSDKESRGHAAKGNRLAQRIWPEVGWIDPGRGVTIIEPPGTGEGHWVGASGVYRDAETAKFYLYYRVREPRPIRGGRMVVAESVDGLRFDSIWEARREQFESDSVEKGSLFRRTDGTWQLFVSYVDPADRRWRVDLIEARAPSEFDVKTRRPVLTAAGIEAEGVKDPYVFAVGDRTFMLLSYAPRPSASPADAAAMHGTGDVFNTGTIKSCTGLAVSRNGVDFEWQGEIFGPPTAGWDSYASRIGSVMRVGPVYLGFYDGSASVKENYEERTGLALSVDLRNWHRLTPEGPILTSPHGTGCLRYLDPLVVGDEVYWYYEYRRADGSHELRLNRTPLCG